jgi:hypothetical protein
MRDTEKRTSASPRPVLPARAEPIKFRSTVATAMLRLPQRRGWPRR